MTPTLLRFADLKARGIVRNWVTLRSAYVYADNRQIVNTLTEDEARRIAANIAKLPGLLAKS
jgi:hypothetical protein